MFATRFSLVVLLTSLCFLSAPGQADKQTLDVRVMSYNIRYGTAQDGDNHWDKRKEFLIDTIKAFGPDLLGTQEPSASSAIIWPRSSPATAFSASAATTAKSRAK